MDPPAARGVPQTPVPVLVLVLVIVAPLVASGPCPRPCSCPQPAELHCTFRSLLAVPAAVPTHVQRMNLGFNSIDRLTDTSLAGLRKLELLMVHGNDIHSLPDGVFGDLTSLQMLKMSYNKLKEINRYTLRGLWALARLHLDHNRLEFIHPDAFQGLTSLRLLQLEGNRLQQLHPATFATFTLTGHFRVSTLRHLYLSDNGLASLPSGLVATMPQLENLYLHGNPWTCDCNMRWLRDWDETSPGVLKCKKDRALPSGQLCPVCSSPRHLQRKELQAVENLVCSSPVISSPHRTSPPSDGENEFMTAGDFSEPFGNISLDLSDEHGNKVNLECSIGEPRELTKPNWEQVNQLQLATNISLAVDLECPVDRENYEQLWRLIAYYSNVPAHLQRGAMLRKEPYPTYVYRQDSEKDAQYYTGVKVDIMAQPAWLMQTSVGLQLDRLQSSAKVAKLVLSTNFSETVEAELVRRQGGRGWVMIESANKTRRALSAILGGSSQMYCNVRSSGQPVIQWTLPDGSKVEAPHSSPDDRVSASGDGRLIIKAVSHADTGVYYCVAKVHGDLAVLPFRLIVQESSSPAPGEDAVNTPIEGFVGNSISLPCTAYGSPDAEINWILPSSNILSFQANSSRALIYSNGTLHIPQTQLSDSGHYKCVAINQHGVDSLAIKVTLNRRKGLIRPLRKFPARPQSASGVNTQIKVPTEDIEEASGDTEITDTGPLMSRLDPPRKRITGGVAPGRRGVQPGRNMWRRPPSLRKPGGSRVEDRKNTVEGRRKINTSKSKIDPEKWADILAKIRDRNSQGAATPLPVEHTTEGKLKEQTTQSHETGEGSSDVVMVREKKGKGDFTTPHTTPAQHTQIETNIRDGQGTHVISNSYTTHNTHDMISNSLHAQGTHATAEPHTPQTTRNEQHATRDTDLDRHTTSENVFFLPQTTSAPLRAVTSWTANTNIASSSTFSPRENHITNTDVNDVKTTDWSKASRSENIDRPNVVARPNNDRELTASGSQIIPLVNPKESETSQEENGKYLRETATTPQPHTQPKNATHNDLQSQAMLTTASPATALVPTTTANGTERQLLTRPQQLDSKRRNGGRRRRPNRRKQKLNKPPQFIATALANAPLEPVGATASMQLKTEPSGVTTAKFDTTVPFSSSQAVSSGTMSHEENTVSGHARLSSLPASFLETDESVLPLAKPVFNSTSVAPSFPTASPEVGHGRTPTASGISESTSPPELLDMLTSATQQRLMGSHLPPVSPLNETQRVGVTGDLPSGGFHTVTPAQTDAGHRYTPTENGGKMLLTTDMYFLLLPSQSASAASLTEHEIRTTSGYSSSGLFTTQNVLESDSDTTTTKKPAAPEKSHHSSSQNKTASSESEFDKHLKETADREINIDAPTMTTPPYAAESTPNAVIPSTVAQHAIISETSSPGAKISPFLRATTQEAPRIKVIPNNHSPDQQIQLVTTSEPQRTPDTATPSTTDLELASFTSTVPTSPALKLTSGQMVKQTAASTPTSATIQHRLPGQGPVPRGMPRITKSNSQTFTVKAETHAQLPCEAEGEPMPFLSWIKVASGVSIAQNTRVRRFEVHPNGTLIIRNAQPMDGGNYMCTVQNQYGTDKKVVNLVVLTQHPRILQPRNRDVTAHIGGKVDLECKAEGYPTPKVTWVLPNRVHMPAAPFGAVSRKRVAVLSDGTLQISQAAYADRGIYECIGSSAAGADMVSVHLDISASPPVIQQTPHENKTLPEGSTAYIHCTATGVPQPVIRWVTPDGVQLTASQFVTGHNHIVFPNGTLSIRGAGPGNAGRYECSASNAVDSRRRTVILSIRRKPSSAKARITSSSSRRTDVIYGGGLLLNCVATGDPEPRITWRTPSMKLVDAQYSFDPRIRVFPNGTITIHSVTEKDSGDYLCVARNKMGDDYVLLRVNVLTRPAKIKQKQQQFSQEVVYGGDLKVDCVASGLPNPEISWALPDGTMVNLIKQSVSGGRSRRYVVFDNGTLYFNDVGMPEEGDYTCYAENQLGKDEMKVRVKVKVETSPSLIQDEDQKIVGVFYGETVTLRCNAKGKPMPVITWISPMNRVISPASDKYQVLDDGTLVVHKVQRFDEGNYTCITRNNARQDHKVIRLKVLVTSPVINGLSGTANTITVAAVQDQRKLLDCVAKGTPTPRIMWVLPGNVILPAPYSSNRMAVHRNGTLEIRSPKKTDSGQLACIARNEGGEVRLVVNLDVKEDDKRPQIRVPKTASLLLTVGKAITLNCSFEGMTLPRVTWILPSGTPLQSGARFSKFFHQPDSSLIISNPSVAEAGMYRCLGHNSQGIAEQTITLFPGRKPEIINRYNSAVSVTSGERLLLHCLTSGEPLRLTWTLPSGVVLNRPQRAGRYAVLPNGTLDIHQVSVFDRGSYVCRATNEYGSSLLSVLVIVVAYPPRITNGPPSVTYAKHGVAVQLNCVATGIPKVEVAWETPDKTRLVVSAQPRLFGNKYLHPQGSLVIQNPTQRDAGVYRCTARNAIGIDAKATLLNVF